MSRRAWIRAGFGVIAALAIVVVAVWYFAVRDVAEPTTVGEAVSNFRETSERGDSPVPAGVYVYATDGFEKTDALTGATHHYPQRSTITVTSDPCGVRMRWDVLKGRSTAWRFCVGDDGWVMKTQDERHTFFHVTEGTTYACSNGLFRPREDRRSPHVRVTCTTPSAKETETQWVVGREPLHVGRTLVSAVHIRQTIRLSGGSRGNSTYDMWLDRKTGVPVRVAMVSRTTNDSPVGDVHYEEVVTLRLQSLDPKR
jgi:hypothetical protein